MPGHLARARSALARNALTTPAGDNAVQWAEAALAADPGNAEAIGVLREVIDRYLQWADRDLSRNALGDARQFLARARAVSEHATRDQLAAADVIEKAIANRQRARGFHIDGPKWLDDIDAWLRNQPLPTDR